MQKLRTLLEERAWRGSLQGHLRLAELQYADVREVSSAFKPMVRDGAFDCGELAIATYMQAFCFGKPLVLLPLVVSGRPAHRSIVAKSDRGIDDPSKLRGRRIGIRSYSQASGMWVRSILQHEYDVDPSQVTWVTLEDAHVAEFTDPPNCGRAPAGSSLKSLLLDDEIDAAIMGSKAIGDDRVGALIPNAEAAGQAWMERYGVRPINHMVVVSQALCQRRPDIVRDLYDGLKAASASSATPFPVGFEGNWKALDMACAYAFEQALVPKLLSSQDLFASARKVLLS